MPQPQAHENEAADQSEHRRPVRNQLLAVIDATLRAPGGAQDVFQVAASDPQSVDDEGEAGAHALMTTVGRGQVVVHAQSLGRGDADHGEEALLELAEHVEDPDTQADVEVDEVGEPDPGEVQSRGERHVGVEEAERWAERESEVWHAGEVSVEPVEAQDDGRQGEADPGPPVAVERTDVVQPPGGALDHLQRHLGHRVVEALVDGPLAVQDDAQADHHEAEDEEEQVPVRQRRGPHFPRYRLSRRQPLVQVGDGLLVLRCYPIGHVIREQLGPLVLLGGVVEAAGDDPDQDADEALVGHRHRHQHHEIDEDEVGPGEGETLSDQPQDHVEDGGDEEEQEQGRGRGGIQGHHGALHHVRPVGGAGADGERERGAEHDAAHAEGRATSLSVGFVGHGRRRNGRRRGCRRHRRLGGGRQQTGRRLGVVLLSGQGERVPDQQLLAQHAQEARVQPAPVEVFAAGAPQDHVDLVHARRRRRREFDTHPLTDSQIERGQPLDEFEEEGRASGRVLATGQAHLFGIDVTGCGAGEGGEIGVEEAAHATDLADADVEREGEAPLVALRWRWPPSPDRIGDRGAGGDPGRIDGREHDEGHHQERCGDAGG